MVVKENPDRKKKRKKEKGKKKTEKREGEKAREGAWVYANKILS